MLALRLLWRDWRGGELRILFAALIVAVAIVTAIGLFVDRLQAGIEAQSKQFLAADRVLRSPRPIAAGWLDMAEQSRLEVAEVVTFSSMVYPGGDDGAVMQLTAVKAVSTAYPLRGALEVAGEAFGAAESTDKGPPPGELWVDSRLLPLLGIAIGDELNIGESRLRVGRVLITEPDRGSLFSGLGPRVMMNTADLPATGIIQPGSRVQYRYLFAGQAADLERFSQWLQPRLEPGYRWVELEENRPRLSRSLRRAEQFLMLAGAVGVGLAGIAIALAARRYSERHYDYVAIMKSLGASRARVIRLYIVNLLLLTLAALLVGAATGWGLQESVVRSLGEFFGLAELPPISIKPFLVSAVTSLVCLAVFALPPLARMSAVSPLRVLRRDFKPFDSGLRSSLALGLLGTAALMMWYSGDWQLTLAVFGGVLATLVSMAGLVWWLLRSASVTGMQAGSVWRLAVAAVRRRGLANSVQVVIFSLSLMLMFTLVATRTSLIEEWRVQIPEGTPNHFLINIGAADVAPLQDAMASAGIATEPLYPMVKGRLLSVNDEPLRERLLKFDPDSGGEGLRRELNLTWSAQLPDGNRLSAGQWWNADSAALELSIESGLAKRLGVELGDKLAFLIGGENLLVTVTSIRELDWDSMKPNFYIVMPPRVLEPYPAGYITSFYLPTGQKTFLNHLIRQFPTVTVIEMDQVLQQIRDIVNRVSAAIEWVLSLVVVSALLVLLASVQSSLDSRFRESAILRTLGAGRRLVLGSLMVEFGALGALSGVLAAVSAECVLYVLQTSLLQMQYVAHPWIWLAAPAVGALIIGLTGYSSCRRVVEASPMTILRAVA